MGDVFNFNEPLKLGVSNILMRVEDAQESADGNAEATHSEIMTVCEESVKLMHGSNVDGLIMIWQDGDAIYTTDAGNTDTLMFVATLKGIQNEILDAALDDVE